MQLITALDYHDIKPVEELVAKLGDKVDYYKVGLELFVSNGYKVIEFLKSKDKKVFLDLKFHDIPNTASQAVAVACSYGVDMVNVHTQGGYDMMRACVDKCNEAGVKYGKRPLLIGVTLLTSLDSKHLGEYGIVESVPEQYVKLLAKSAKESGLDGVVSSALETVAIKEALGSDFITVTPGIRLKDDSVGDQKRVVTPSMAKEFKTDYIVVGRSITAAADPILAVDMITKEMV